MRKVVLYDKDEKDLGTLMYCAALPARTSFLVASYTLGADGGTLEAAQQGKYDS